MFSQQITVDNNVGLQPLIEDNLVDGCVDISNITSSVNGSPHGLPSFGYFERAGSNFPFENGIMLSTGNAASAGNGVITPTLSEGSSIWGTDPDLETALGISNTQNATSIEFDIVSISSQFQFNYLFASEDYDGINPCQVSDGFVFLIRESSSTGPYQNIAVVPGTSTPVNTSTVHTNLLPACAAQNEQYFDGYNIGDTNYIGRTTVLTASTTITPLVSYHVKLIIADQTDGTFDSAVFIEGNSFKILDLGDDIATCSSTAILDADVQNPQAFYQWFLDGNVITGENNPTLNAIQSGTYRVEVTVSLNGNNCVEEDEIIVVLNTEESITPISDYELCDDSSGDGIETFDLSTKSVELTANIPFTNYTFSYHYSEAEARSNVNSITTPITNTTSPQNIFVRIDDLDSNCFAYTNFNLIVNPVPTIVPPTPLEICDSDDSPDGYTVIDLTEKDNEITSGNTNLNVTYHYNPIDASTGNNPIPSPYINISSPTDIVYVRIVDLQTGCVNTTSMNVNITTSPIVNRDTQYLDACDTDMDGSASFDLTQVIANILQGLTNVTITFHESYDDAESGTNAIADETNYQYTNAVTEPGSATLYVRIEDNNTGCPSLVPLEIHTNLLLTGTDTGDFALCDLNEDTTDTLDFNLNTVEAFIANDLPLPITVTFFETENERDTNTNPIDKTQLFAAESPTTLYIRIEDGNCSEVAEITLLVNPILLFAPTEPVPYCDTDDDGTVSVELATLDGIITNNNPNFTVSYFPTQTDAQSNINAHPPFYDVTLQETIFARIEHVTTGCNTINEFEIRIDLAPAATQPTPIIICDNDQDGFSIINLEDKIPEIVASTTGLNIDFFTSLDDANTFTNPIPTGNLTTYNTDTQTIYVRVESNINTTGCYNIVEQDVIVNTLPNIPTISNFQVCQTGGSSVADFILADKDLEILNGQTNKEVYYFEDAAFTLPIDKNNVYQNTSSPQTIYVRVENITDATCYGTSSFILQVSPDPIYNVPTPFLVCDDITNDEIENFNLDEKITEISQGSTDVLNITFHTTRIHAEDNANAIPTTSPYTNVANPQTLYVRIESEDSLCFVIEELSLNIIASPDITQVTAPLIECDADYDGLTTFNLETADFDILDRIQTNLIVNYFEDLSDINENDGLDNSNEISDPQNFVSNSKTVYIKVANTLTRCFSVIPLELIVNLPPATNNLGTIPICDNDTNTFDLIPVDDMIVNDSSLVTISYHNALIDAENNVAAIVNTFNYTASNHTIYVRVTDNVTNCTIITSFNLLINPNPVANSAPDLTDCDDDFDGFLEFILSQNTNIIIGSQDQSQHTVTYYSEMTDAQNASNPLNNIHSAYDGEVIYARLENNNTGCFDITQFSIYVNPLPIIPIDDVVPLCINDLPLIIDAYTGNDSDTYLWSTGETSSQIQLSNPSDIGDYWVTVTTPHIGSNNCRDTKVFTVIESEDANINFTTTIDFADPNSITVDISGIGDYVYILDDGEPQTSNVFENVTYGVHTITIRDLNGCNDVQTDVIVYDIPKFVTPNNDGANDTWHIIGVNQLPGTLVYIYNRHGKLLKTLPYTSIGWDGTYNGQNMPSDDYWFVAKVVQNGNAFNLKGHFALKR